jgi:hypothetical protein
VSIEQVRAESARHGLELDEKAVRRISHELGARILAARFRDLMLFSRGAVPPGCEFADKRIAVGIDGDRFRMRTVIQMWA